MIRKKTLKKNYGPVSILANLLKIYEKIMSTQVWLSLSKLKFLSVNVDFAKGSAHNNFF